MRKRVESWFKATAGVIHDRPRRFILIVVVLAVGLGHQLSRLHIDTSNESFSHKSDPVLAAHDNMRFSTIV